MQYPRVFTTLAVLLTSAVAAAQGPLAITDFVNEYSNIRQLKPAGDRVFFTAYSEEHGTELWVADAGGAGAHVVMDVTSGLEDLPLWGMHAAEGVCHFIMGYPNTTFWRTDGTPGGTQQLANLPQIGLDLYGEMSMLPLNGSLLMLFPTATEETVLWRTDGTAGGTAEVWRDAYGNTPLGYIDLDLVRLGNAAYFGQLDTQNRTVLYRTDGTSGGTQAVTIVTESSFISGISTFPGTPSRFFLFDQAAGLYGSDGTAAGTQALPIDRSADFRCAVLDGFAYFGTVDLANAELVLWKTDGTAAGSVELERFSFSAAALSYPGGMEQFKALVTATSDAVFFVAPDDTDGVSLFKTDGDSVTLVRQLVPMDIMWLDAGEPLVGEMAALGREVYFPAFGAFMNGESTGMELWTSNGAAAGTRLLIDLYPGGESSYPDMLTRNGEQLCFVGSNGIGHQIWLYPELTEIPCTPNGGGLYETGEALCLSVPGPVDNSAGFQWFKDGVPLSDGDRITGAQSQSISIAYLMAEDSGLYTCEYDDGSKAPAVYGPIPVEVVSQVPAVGGAGLAMLGIAFLAFAARRRGKA